MQLNNNPLAQLFSYPHPITLESGTILPSFHLAYTTHGKLNAAGDNVVWVFHALTANSDPAQWWPGLVGEGRLFDPSSYFIVCVNMPGSHYGSISPLDSDPLSGEPYYHDFPFFTPRDMITAYRPLREFLGIRTIHIGIGGSMGGQQLLEWAIEEPELFSYIFPIATNARHSSWGIAFNTAQRMAIEADATWKERHPSAGTAGMKAARATALLSYRHYDTYAQTQPRPEDFVTEEGPSTQKSSPGQILREAGLPEQRLSESAPSVGGPTSTQQSPGEPGLPEPRLSRPDHPVGGPTSSPENPASYQRYQGDKLARRFSAFNYYTLSLSMDAHDVGRGRGGVETALQRIRAHTLVIGIETDLLFPLPEQRSLASMIPGAAFQTIYSLYGHDGFLLEFEQIGQLINHFLITTTPTHARHRVLPGAKRSAKNINN